MQFLVIAKPRSAPPLEMTLPLIEAMEAWVAQHRASGKAKALWSLAGYAGGGGVLDVDSHEELDEIMASFPFAPFSTIEVLALGDLDRALQATKAVVQRMAEAMGSPR